MYSTDSLSPAMRTNSLLASLHRELTADERLRARLRSQVSAPSLAAYFYCVFEGWGPDPVVLVEYVEGETVAEFIRRNGADALRGRTPALHRIVFLADVKCETADAAVRVTDVGFAYPEEAPDMRRHGTWMATAESMPIRANSRIHVVGGALWWSAKGEPDKVREALQGIPGWGGTLRVVSASKGCEFRLGGVAPHTPGPKDAAAAAEAEPARKNRWAMRCTVILFSTIAVAASAWLGGSEKRRDSILDAGSANNAVPGVDTPAAVKVEEPAPGLLDNHLDGSKVPGLGRRLHPDLAVSTGDKHRIGRPGHAANRPEPAHEIEQPGRELPSVNLPQPVEKEH